MTMSDNITAYSTAVGPSSHVRKPQSFFSNDFMAYFYPKTVNVQVHPACTFLLKD